MIHMEIQFQIKKETINKIEKSLLSTLLKNESGVCVGVNDSSSEFLQYLDKKGIRL